MRDFRQRVRNIFLGGSSGDQIGLDGEMMSRDEILDATGGRGIRGFPTGIDRRKRKIPDTRGLPPNATSDDTCFRDVTAMGYIMTAGYHHELYELLHVKALRENAAGAGKNTKFGIYGIDKRYLSSWQRLRRHAFPPAYVAKKDHALWREAPPRKPLQPPPPRKGSRGNGVGMKISPNGVYHGLRMACECGGFENVLDDAMYYGRITHADPLSSIAAFAVASLIAHLLSDPEATTFGLGATLMANVMQAEAEYEKEFFDDARFSPALNRAFDLMNEPEKLWLFGASGRSDALTSIPMAIAIFFRNFRDPRAALLEAVNAGGDTDTVGAMVGAMAGATSDREDCWPSNWIEALPDQGASAIRLADDLHDVALGLRPPAGYDIPALKRELGYCV